MPHRTVVRLVPKLSIAALKAKLDRELTLWYCLRARNHWGSGRLGLEDAIDTHVSVFGYSASMAYGTLTDDDGLFLTKWPMKNINSLQIEIYWVKRNTRYSDTPCGCFVEIPIINSMRYEGQSVIQL